ncbi:MAG: response regulator transcription factor [Janthinobacterium lividum]
MVEVLLIEDDNGTAAEIVSELVRYGHTVRHEPDGIAALRVAQDGRFDVLIVDRMLPNLEGLDLIASLRKTGVRTPALVLSALGSLDDRVRGLRAGGDDYLPKPFALVELVARLEALLRRPAETRETMLRLGPLELDLLNHTGWRSGRPLQLLPREMQLLEYLMRRPGGTVTRSMLLQDVWGYRFEPRSNVVDVHMSKLRRKVDGPGEAALLHSVRGIGYRLDAHR